MSEASAKRVLGYTCAMCEARFEPAWQRDETAREKLARFGSGADPNDVVLLCDGCRDDLMRGEESVS